MPTTQHFLRFGALGASLTLLGCAKKAEVLGPAVASGLVIVQGNNQAAQAGQQLPTPVLLRVVDASGVGMPGLPVTLALGAGGGLISPASATSDSKGEVTAKWTLGPTMQSQTLIATTPGIDAVILSAYAILPADVIVAQGNGQTAKAGTALPNSIVIRVVGDGNVPLVGVPVALQITGGGGAISPQTSLTSSLGEVTVKWTLGTVAGLNTASINVGILSPVTLTATGTP